MGSALRMCNGPDWPILGLLTHEAKALQKPVTLIRFYMYIITINQKMLDVVSISFYIFQII